jgi:hypothetical protein
MLDNLALVMEKLILMNNDKNVVGDVKAIRIPHNFPVALSPDFFPKGEIKGGRRWRL